MPSLWLYNQFGGGLNEKPLTGASYSPDCRNVIARVSDLLEKRKGQKRLNVTELDNPITGAGALYIGDERCLIVVAGNKAYQYDWDTETFNMIKEEIKGERTQFVMGVNFLIAFDGETAPWKTDGTTITDITNAPEDGWLIELYREKFFTVRLSDPSTLLFSSSFDPEDWPVIHMWPIGDGDGDIITAVKHYKAQDHLAIFKQNTIWALRGTSLEDMELSGPQAEPGCVGPNAIVEDRGMLYYVARDGIYAYNGYQSAPITRDKIPKLWQTVNQDALKWACASKHDGLLWFSLPVGEDYNNFVLVLDPTTGAIWPYDGIHASLFCHYIDNDNEQYLLTGSSKDGYMVLQDTGLTDFDRPVSGYYSFPLTGATEPSRRKKLQKLIINAAPESGAFDPVMVLSGVDPYLPTDGTAEPQVIDLPTPDPNTLGYDPAYQKYSFPPGTYCRYFQPVIYHYQPRHMMKVRSVEIQYKSQARR